MKQLELDFNSINLSDHYEAYRVIDEGKNQICSWSDSLSDDGKKISYDEYTYNTTQCMDFENWIHIDKNGLGKSAFKWFCMYLKSINGRADRLVKLKRVALSDGELKDKEVGFLVRMKQAWGYQYFD